MYSHFLAFATLFVALSVAAQTDGAVAAFDSGYVETGNPFALHLTVPGWQAQPESVDFSAWASVIPAENILAQSGWQNRDGRWQNDLTLIVFDSAEHLLPPLVISLADGNRLPTNPLKLRVLPTPSPDELTELHDIRDIRREPAHWTDFWLPFALIAGGVLLLALAVWWFLLRKKKSGLQGERRLRLPPHELALRQLDELERRQYWQQGHFKAYYSELTRIARAYLEERYGIPALESPSNDILRLLTGTDIPPALLPPLDDVLHWADLAKFAKTDPPEYFHAQALREVRRLVEQTRPVESPEPALPPQLKTQNSKLKT